MEGVPVAEGEVSEVSAASGEEYRASWGAEDVVDGDRVVVVVVAERVDAWVDTDKP